MHSSSNTEPKLMAHKSDHRVRSGVRSSRHHINLRMTDDPSNAPPAGDEPSDASTEAPEPTLSGFDYFERAVKPRDVLPETTQRILKEWMFSAANIRHPSAHPCRRDVGDSSGRRSLNRARPPRAAANAALRARNPSSARGTPGGGGGGSAVPRLDTRDDARYPTPPELVPRGRVGFGSSRLEGRSRTPTGSDARESFLTVVTESIPP